MDRITWSGSYNGELYALNKVMMRYESSSDEDEMAKRPIGDLNKGRRSGVYMMDNLSFLSFDVSSFSLARCFPISIEKISQLV